jgi:urease accessory protein
MLGIAGVEVPWAETGIGLSVVVLGFAIAFHLSLPTLASIALVGFFAIFHGHVHGAEMPESVFGLAYGIGFVSATALLLGVGFGLAWLIGSAGQFSRRIEQLGGGAMVVAGVAILTGIL